MKKRNFLFTAIVSFVVSFVFIECSKTSYENNGGGNGGGGGGGSNSATVYMKNSVFASANVTITSGGTVTWTNNDNMVHTVTANDNSFNSGDVQVNGSFSRTFTATGTYPYHCNYHTGMVGSVIVIAQ